MSYPVRQPPGTVPPAGGTPIPVAAPPGGRPSTVTAAAALLWAMAAVGLVYAVVTLVVVPGVVGRFYAANPERGEESTTYVTVIWLGAGIALAMSVILAALYVVLGIALRRGSNPARIAILVLCVLGVLGGGISAFLVGVQRGGVPAPGSLGESLTAAYPAGWIATNVGLEVAQVVAYVLVGILVLIAPRSFFGRAAGSPPAVSPPYGYGGYLSPGVGFTAPHGGAGPATPPGDAEKYWSRPAD